MKKSTKLVLYSMPAVLLIAGTIFMGSIIAVAQSFGYFPEIGLRQFTLSYYKEIFGTPMLWSSFLYSFKTAIISSLLGVGFGFVLSYALVCRPKEWPLYKRFTILPVAIPHIIVVAIVFNLFIRTGFIARVLIATGLIESHVQFPNLLFSSSGFGVVAVYFWKAFPYTVMVVYSVLKSMDKSYKSVTLNLGANQWQYFIHVVLPLARPLLLTTTIILFAFSFSAYEVPYLLGATVPKALPVQAYIEYTSPFLENRPIAMAINVVMIVIALLLVSLYDWLASKTERWTRRE
jgi:putative spermidine/putrescine transport system permease protein